MPLVRWMVDALSRHFYGTIEDRTAMLEPATRMSLAEEIIEESASHSSVTKIEEELDGRLEEAQEQLRLLERKEQFIYSRLDKYRRIHQSIASQEVDDDYRQGHPHNQQQQQQQQHTQLLNNITQQHKELLANVERLRRRIETMEEKRNAILLQEKECQEFLNATERLQQESKSDNIEKKSLIFPSQNKPLQVV